MGGRALNNLLFRPDGDRTVIPEHLAPSVAWLCLWDAPTRAQVMVTDPGLLIGQGDPSGLPDADRADLLRAFAGRYVDRQRLFEHFDGPSLERFASPVIAASIEVMLEDRGTPEEQVVEMGSIERCVTTARDLALDASVGNHVRYWAIRAVGGVGSDTQREALLPMLTQTATWEHDVGGAFVQALYPDQLDSAGLVQLLEKTTPSGQNTTTSLDVVLEHEVPNVGDINHRLDLLERLLAGRPTRGCERG